MTYQSHAIRQMIRDMNAEDARLCPWQMSSQQDMRDHLYGVLAILFAGLCGVLPFIIIGMDVMP